jgi:hypothetical protein
MPLTNIPKPPKKTIDLPPTGLGNDDPLTGQPGAHPIETGIGTALAGTATGMILGVAAGPVGAVAGAVGGGRAGGYAGHVVGETIDPTDPALLDPAQSNDLPAAVPVLPGTSVGATFTELEHESPNGFLTTPTQSPT